MIQIPRSQLLAALALGAAFVLVVAATVAVRSIGAPSGEGASRTLDDVARSTGLHFGAEGTPELLAYAPLVIAPPPPPASPASQYAFIWPDDYYLVQGMWAGHPLGIDIGTPPGEAVLAVRDGRVIFAGGDPCCNYGLFVIVEHDDGWSSLYAHFSQLDVDYGDEVRQGQQLGLSGGTGKVSGPHVHFELRHYGGVVDPLGYLEPHRAWAVTADLIAGLEQQPASIPEAGRDGAAIADGEPAPVAAAESSAPNALNSLSAIDLASRWLSSQEQSAYYINASTCSAAQTGPNWWVTCTGQLQGCRGQACVEQLTACVFDQPRLVAAACP